MKEEQYWKAGDLFSKRKKAGTLLNRQNNKTRGFIQELKYLTGWIKAGGVVRRVNSEGYDPKFSREKVLYL